MYRSIAKLVLLLATAVVSCGFFVAAHAQQVVQPAHASCRPRERDALLAFKQLINGTYDDVLVSWQKRHHDCCRWTGITCSKETGHVTELDIGGTRLVGQISPSLISLEHLEYLNLNNTLLLGPNGLVFPEFLCSLHNLRHLDLSGTPFSGRVPAQLANLSKLEYLDLSSTDLSAGKTTAASYSRPHNRRLVQPSSDPTVKSQSLSSHHSGARASYALIGSYSGIGSLEESD
ncbi:hypothetical protein QYE76_054459 [Lolium multiflorum]|uniref:Leucine-rich repeat-containing N-terminal plant-type domain-containing protein n=1 Tax=Lolium multiflorum TaxID=4521 RepID=A0AAD8SZ48_LOLMU|nr:hypothetical protein QYE76_054459 [Lolium multiflorum]